MEKYINVVETAKLLRKALKEAFPTIKFKVKSNSYSGGASIDVKYVDGPTYDAVNKIAKQFQGCYFDGMTDYKGYLYKSFQGEEVTFGANFVFVKREFSAPALAKILDATAVYWGFENAGFEIVDNGFGAYIKDGWNVQIPNAGNTNVAELVAKKAADTAFVEPLPSPTAEAIVFLGDDGYGYGCVGKLKKEAA